MSFPDDFRARIASMPTPLLAAAWMVGASLFFAGLSGVIRHLGQQMHPFEVAFFRNLFGLVVMLPWLWRIGFGVLKTKRLNLYISRSALSLFSMLCWFTALPMLPFEQAVALSFTAPLFATVCAALVLRETVRGRRWTATILGFVGVLIIVRPGLGDVAPSDAVEEIFAIGALLAILSAMTSAVLTIIVKNLARTEPSDAIVTYMVLLLTPMSLVPAVFVWQWPTGEQWPWLIAMGALGSFGHMCYMRAFAIADASAVMPYDYTRLIFAAVIGYLAFAEVPDLWTWIGAAVIASSAIYIAHRESVRRQSTATRAAAAVGSTAVNPADPAAAERSRP
jgi:drug/metabolite transporter (DMT)-like permease